jgi:UDP-N-acetylglucosamine--N-acetylmuramyl-(pentapeptide) pyrophosphoryl-undecaprenol N-acetylglucosamine transferase
MLSALIRDDERCGVSVRDVESDVDRTGDDWLRPGRTLLVASTGGHLEQLYRLRQRFQPALGDVEWATFDTGQSRHLLAEETVHYVPFVKPKDASGTLRSGAAALRLLGQGRFSRVMSTGAAVALPFLGRARSIGLAAHYIESAARSDGPSLTGRLVAKVPGVRLYGQYPVWTHGRWQFRGAVFDGFEAGPPRPTPAGGLSRVVVTFGTQRDFGFRRAAEQLVQVLPEICAPDAEVLWQTGATDMSGLGVQAVEAVPAADLEAAVGAADLVISHAGVGTSLLSLELGRCPVLLPRRHAHGEHTDDHQRLIAAELQARRLAVEADAGSVSADQLLGAAAMTASRVAHPPAFLLQPDLGRRLASSAGGGRRQ